MIEMEGARTDTNNEFVERANAEVGLRRRKKKDSKRALIEIRAIHGCKKESQARKPIRQRSV